MRIGYVISRLTNSGPVNIIYNIIKYLDKENIKVFIFTLSDENQNSREKDFKELGCKIIKLEIGNTDLLFRPEEANKLFVDYRIDILHANCFRSTLLLSRMKGLKKITTVHNYPINDYYYQFGMIKGSLMTMLFISSLKKLDKVVACSESISKHLLKKYGVISKAIQNGVDLEVFNSSLKSREQIREEIGIRNDSICFIAVGTLSNRKNVYWLAKRFIEASLNNCYLLFVGDGPLKQRIEELKDNRIRIIGNISNVAAYLNASDYYISASKAEGLPTSVIEALACKMPVILSNIAPHREILGQSENAGIIYKRNELCKIIEDISKESFVFSKEAAYEVVKSRLNAKRMALDYYYLYKGIINEDL